MRICAAVEYDGTDFFGWQSQSHARSVQDCVQGALSKVADHPVVVACAGRTDTGVHAWRQVIHFDTAASRTPREWLRGANANLPDDVCLRRVQAASDDFHARVSAIRRHYRYVILNDDVPSALLRNRCTRISQTLNADAMHDAAQALVGEHDFSGYRSAGCQSRSPMRTVESLRVWRDGCFIYIDICANAFLQHMVRNIAGVLIEVGHGEQPCDWPAQVLAQRDRRSGGVTAPSKGLYLVGVEYDASHSLPEGITFPQILR